MPDSDILVDGVDTESQTSQRSMSLGQRLREFMRGTTVLVLETFAVFLALFVMGVLIKRWVQYGIECVKRLIFEYFDRFWEWLDYVSPSPTPEIREDKQAEVRKLVLESIDQLCGDWKEWMPWKWMTWWEISGLLVCITLFGLIVYYSMRLTLYSTRRIIYRARGIQLESTRAGSDFRSGKMPTFQVRIALPGLFMSSHLGYGARRGNYLVTAKHVIERNGGFLTEALLTGTKASIITDLTVEVSRVFDDLVYIHLDEKTWSLLGTTKGKWVREATTVYASIYGQCGLSTGRLCKTSVQWQLAYTGSTLPGFSGAPYVEGTTIHGIHTGSASKFNVGVSSVLIGAEVAKLVRVETPPNMEEEYVPRFTNSDKVWNQVSALDDLEKRYASDSWANKQDDDDDFYNQKLQFDLEKSKPATTLTIPTGSVLKLKNQNSENEEHTQVLMNRSDAQFLLALRTERIMSRVMQLEHDVGKLMGKSKLNAPQLRYQPKTAKTSESESKTESEPKQVEKESAPVETPEQKTTPKAVKIICQQCGQMAKSAEKLARHVKASHPETKESAIPSDTGKTNATVKQGRFLGMRKGSRKNSGPNSRSTSSSSEGNKPSQAPAENLKDMRDSQKNIEKCLNELLTLMRGQNLAQTQN